MQAPSLNANFTHSVPRMMSSLKDRAHTAAAAANWPAPIPTK